MSSILRKGAERGGVVSAAPEPETDADLGGAVLISSMLLVGGFGERGEDAAPWEASRCCEAGVPSNIANTSFRSSSSIVSRDIFLF